MKKPRGGKNDPPHLCKIGLNVPSCSCEALKTSLKGKINQKLR